MSCYSSFLVLFHVPLLSIAAGFIADSGERRKIQERDKDLHYFEVIRLLLNRPMVF